MNNEPTTRRFEGNYLVWRVLDGGRLRRKVGGKHKPRFRHPTFESAETEAARLATLFPESSFVIMQEVATVKVREEEAANVLEPA